MLLYKRIWLSVSIYTHTSNSLDNVWLLTLLDFSLFILTWQLCWILGNLWLRLIAGSVTMFQNSLGYSLVWRELSSNVLDQNGTLLLPRVSCWSGFYTVEDGSRDCNADEISFPSRVCTFPGKGGTLEFQCGNSWLCPANKRSVIFTDK